MFGYFFHPLSHRTPHRLTYCRLSFKTDKMVLMAKKFLLIVIKYYL